jgi:hypothetical protein
MRAASPEEKAADLKTNSNTIRKTVHATKRDTRLKATKP